MKKCNWQNMFSHEGSQTCLKTFSPLTAVGLFIWPSAFDRCRQINKLLSRRVNIYLILIVIYQIWTIFILYIGNKNNLTVTTVRCVLRKISRERTFYWWKRICWLMPWNNVRPWTLRVRVAKQRSNVNMSIERAHSTSCLKAIAMFARFVTICMVSAVKMYMTSTLTFKICQG